MMPLNSSGAIGARASGNTLKQQGGYCVLGAPYRGKRY